ncbi:related to GPI18-mannosyltransferase [Sporisorium reilianum f. sp. reilianum]|uniref:GPI mannosyltransferase 2 n=1 Tax=Sporisorium reilianum f. sp. reilianum TaxID=72559 RepID=A0A2N8ULC2_9BASI|nr:related to GPI18-mannosyltransferase [Sporisorium reilianum f. sp. reilianum]
MVHRRLAASQPSPSTDRNTAQHAHATPHKLAAVQAQLLKLSLLVRLVSVTLLIVASQLQQAFNTSHELLSYSLDPHTAHGLSAGPFKWALALVRWDTVYFVASASPSVDSVHSGGYAWEQTLAFQPGIVALLRVAGYLTPSLSGEWSPTSAILVTAVLANLAAALSPVLLHRLTWNVTRNARLAWSAAVLSMFAPSAATTLAAPTPESFFSLASLVGLLHLESSARLGWVRLLAASFWFAVATSFRTNGVLLIGYIAFKLVGEARLGGAVSAATKMVVATAVCVSPSVLFQAWAYSRFCLVAKRPWCEAQPPSIYTFVQSHYWHVGLLRYWQPAQLPNFVLAAPVLVAIAYTAYAFYRHSTRTQIAASLIPLPRTSRSATDEVSLHTHAHAVPYVIHAAVLGGVLLFASHVQIALRLATPGGMPAVWWGAAQATLGLRWRGAVLAYVAVQYCVAVVLYAGFYPPA